MKKVDISVIAPEGTECPTPGDVAQLLNRRLTETKAANPNGYLDAFEQRLELHLLEIAEELGAVLEERQGTYYFVYGGLDVDSCLATIERDEAEAAR